jgi:hypothetical protein
MCEAIDTELLLDVPFGSMEVEVPIGEGVPELLDRSPPKPLCYLNLYAT